MYTCIVFCLSTTENLPSIFTRQRDFIIEVKVIYDLYSGAYNTFVMYRSFPTNYSILLFVLCLNEQLFLLNMFVFLCCQGWPVWQWPSPRGSPRSSWSVTRGWQAKHWRVRGCTKFCQPRICLNSLSIKHWRASFSQESLQFLSSHWGVR